MVEMAISLAIFTLLASSLLSLSLKSSKFVGTNDAEVAVQLEGNRAFSRMTEVLRKTGRVDDGVTVYLQPVDADTHVINRRQTEPFPDLVDTPNPVEHALKRHFDECFYQFAVKVLLDALLGARNR